jgi:TPR repeat protein
MIRRHVENDNPAAVRHLGSKYEYGAPGIVKSHKKAARLYQRAAELGDVVAMNNIGFAYEYGEGVKLDKKKAAKYFRMAADRGHAKAQFNLARLHFTGKGVEFDESEAVCLFRMAALQGFSQAEWFFGGSPEHARDAEESLRFLKSAAAKGNEMAKAALVGRSSASDGA